jgi:hypothetical protein
MSPFALRKGYEERASSWHQRQPLLMPSLSEIRHLSHKIIRHRIYERQYLAGTRRLNFPLADARTSVFWQVFLRKRPGCSPSLFGVETGVEGERALDQWRCAA